MHVTYKKKIKALGNTPYVIERFDSASEVIEVNDSRKPRDNFTHEFTRERVANNPDWYGCKNYEEAETYMKTGYQPTVDAMKDVGRINLGGEGKRVKFKNDVVGFTPVVPLVLLGVPNSMVNTYMKPIKSKVLNVYYNMSVNCGVSSNDLIQAGQKLLGAIMELEMQGYRFNLYCVQAYQRKGESGNILCTKVKNANTPLDLKRISFPLTHTSYFRVIGFDWYSRHPETTYLSCFGRPLRSDYNDEAIQKGFEEMFGEKCVVFDAGNCVHKDRKQFEEVLTNAKPV